MPSTATKQIPFISSQTTGPLGVAHLPRLWTKLTLGYADQLADGWDHCGHGFDQMTIDALGLEREKVLEYFRTHKPTYVQFEEWVVKHGKTDHDAIKHHNAAVHGYNHGDETGNAIREVVGLKDDKVKDAVTLNMLEDLHELHKQLHG